MPENPFLKFQNYETKPPRNSVDLSYRYNASFGLGSLYPVLCLEVNPGETFSIESAIGLKFFPMPFPVQTPMKATMHYYYVRTRTVWKDFVDFIYGNKSASVVPHPFISRPASDKEFWNTGGIADYLGVPTEIIMDNAKSIISVGVIGVSNRTGALSLPDITIINVSGAASSIATNPTAVQYYHSLVLHLGNFSNYSQLIPENHDSVPVLGNAIDFDMLGFDETVPDDMFGVFSAPIVSPIAYDPTEDFSFRFFNAQNPPAVAATPQTMTVVAFVAPKNAPDVPPMEATYVNDGEQPEGGYLSVTYGLSTDGVVSLTASSENLHLLELVNNYLSTGNYKVWFFFGVLGQEYSKTDGYPISLPSNPLAPGYSNFGASFSLSVHTGIATSLGENPVMNPFAGDTPAVALSAIPFRCYEAIYNAYYRNERLEPLIIDGQPEYNVYSPSMDSGADSYPYTIHKRNWEADFLTTALPTPQQGIAPVVGVVGLSNIQIMDPETQEIYNFTAEVDDNDGETVVGGSFHNPDASLAARRTAQDIVTAGFTINDFRNVSALQRWVENNIRRGLKYRDQVLANTGIKPRYDELDMPEFIGGFSRPVTVSSITQTAPGGDAGLGDFAGQANCFAASKHRINHYCDEAGFIIGILSVVPTPVYSQLLPKHFLKDGPLDYHHPVFNHIGMQPILYREVAPLQVYCENPTGSGEGKVKFNDVFGYQRPYYDLLAKTDEVHGLMRTTMRNYVMNRTFSGVPELGASFVHVDPDQLNDVFSVTDGSDVIMGEIYHRVYAKRPVSLFGQPKIV